MRTGRGRHYCIGAGRGGFRRPQQEVIITESTPGFVISDGCKGIQPATKERLCGPTDLGTFKYLYHRMGRVQQERRSHKLRKGPDDARETGVYPKEMKTTEGVSTREKLSHFY